MRAVAVITDSEDLKHFERVCLAGSHGFTIIPTVWGRGRTGLKTGDRVHPGGSTLLFTVVEDGETEGVLRTLQAVRDEAGIGDTTKILVVPVDRMV